jgi:hypothetical protein
MSTEAPFAAAARSLSISIMIALRCKLVRQIGVHRVTPASDDAAEAEKGLPRWIVGTPKKSLNAVLANATCKQRCVYSHGRREPRSLTSHFILSAAFAAGRGHLASAFWLVSVAGFLGCVAVVKQRRRIRGSAVQHKSRTRHAGTISPGLRRLRRAAPIQKRLANSTLV